MKLGIDAREIQNGVYTGIGRSLLDLLRYTDELLSSPAGAATGIEQVVLFSARPLPLTFSAKLTNRVIPSCATWWWDQVRLTAAVRHEKVDVFYSPYYKIPLLAPCRKVAAVLDLIYLWYPPYRQAMPWWRKAYYHSIGRIFAHAADRVMTCSEFSRQDIVRAYGLSGDKITVVPLAVSPCFRPDPDYKDIVAMKKRYKIDGRYILYVGNFKAHKNVETLVHAFHILCEEYSDIQLVLAGPKTDGYQPLVDLSRRVGVLDQVVFTDVIKDEEQTRLLYAGAEVFVMPSLYEGFGLPPVEAMACGAAVVCSRASSLPEAVGDAAVLVDATQAPCIAEAVRGLLRHTGIDQAFVAEGFRRAYALRRDAVMAYWLELLRIT